jgi:hypothetical protein
LFAQSVAAAAIDDLVEMGDVAFDGTKILANASMHIPVKMGDRSGLKVAIGSGTINGVIGAKRRWHILYLPV